MQKLFRRFLKDERGMETVEWAVMAALLLVGLIAVVGALGDKVLAVFTALDSEIGTAVPQ